MLLTHGSLHRHACRRDTITWADFRRHMDTAFIWYGRAWKSASVQNHLQHKLNALTYMTDLCLKAMRFVSFGTPVAVITIERTLEVLQKLRADPPEAPSVTNSAISLHKQTLFRTLNENIPTLLFIEALSTSSKSPEQVAKLKKSWSDFATTVKDHFRQTKPHLRIKYSSVIWKRIERMFRFGDLCNPTISRNVAAAISPSLFAILDATNPRNGPHLRAWDQVNALVREYSTQEANQTS